MSEFDPYAPEALAAPHDSWAELRERCGRLARAAVEVEDTLLRQVAERALDDRRQLDRLRAGPVRRVPRSDVLLGRLHHAPSE